MKTIIATVALLAGCGSTSSTSTTVREEPVPTTEAADSVESAAETAAPTAASATEAPPADTTAPSVESPEDVANALTEAGLCDAPTRYEREPGSMEAAGLTPPVDEWQCRSTAGLVLIQQFGTAGDLHDAAVVVAAAGLADAPVLDLGDGLVLDANNGSDATITVEDETAWLTEAATIVGGTITLMKDL